ncbi:MAG: hypothetical protein R3A10_13645 [Caldilineaceae bacterium]
MAVRRRLRTTTGCAEAAQQPGHHRAFYEHDPATARSLHESSLAIRRGS